MEKAKKQEHLYKGRILNLRVDTVVLPSGKETIREVVEHLDAVGILVYHENKILFVKQYRYAIDSEMLEIPAGLIKEGEEPIECAQRELREETGYMANDLKEITSFYTSPGFCNEKIYLFYATDISWSPLSADGDENIEPLFLTVDEVKQYLKDGVFKDAKTFAALNWFFANVLGGEVDV